MMGKMHNVVMQKPEVYVWYKTAAKSSPRATSWKEAKENIRKLRGEIVTNVETQEEKCTPI